MFHGFDNLPHDQVPGRAQWMALLSRAPVALLESALANREVHTPQWLRPPETGLMMVQGRAGATGERFNLGEVTVTRCALRLSQASDTQAWVGVAYVLGRSHRQARLIATADALLQDPAQQGRLVSSLLQPIQQLIREAAQRQQSRAQDTTVEFFTVAREAGAPDDDEDPV